MTAAPEPARQHDTCLNCATVLRGPFCHACGQHALHMPRSLVEILSEFAEMLTHADGRALRTLRRLAVAPARLSRDYVLGRRASEIPPVRLFFVALLAVFTLSSFSGPHRFEIAAGPDHRDIAHDPAARAQIDRAIARVVWPGHPRASAWARAHLATAIDDPRELLHVMAEWAERFALLFVPITAAVLWLLHAWPRPVAMFDHLVVTLHSLSFPMLSAIVLTLLQAVLPAPVGSLCALIWFGIAAAHLFAHLRGFYGHSTAGTLVRMTLLACLTGVAAILLLTALTLTGLALDG